MESDITPIPYVVLATRVIERCYSDWNHFCLRVKKDGSSNSSRLRVALAQFCRSQRELFLKLRTLHPFVRPQTQSALNRLLQDSVTAQQILPNTMWSSRESLLQMGLMAPPSNLSVAVDVLSTFNYTRLPVLLDQTVKMAETGDIQLIDYGFSEFDSVKRRLEDEYLITFNKSNIPKNLVDLIYKNGHADFIVKNYFSVSVIYDLTRWQVLDTILDIVQDMNIQSTGVLKDTFLQLIVSSVENIYKINENIENKEIQAENPTNNVFEIIYKVGMRFCTKLLLESLHEQSLNYKSNSNRITNINFTRNNIPIVTCSNVFSGVISLVVEINRVPLCIKNDQNDQKLDIQNIENLINIFQRINRLKFSINLDNGIKEYTDNFPFKISINSIPDELNMIYIENYINKNTLKAFQLNYWINYFFYVLELILIEILQNKFSENIIKVENTNISTLSVYDDNLFIGSIILSRFTGNILFRISNRFDMINRLTKKLISLECSTSIESFKSILHLLIGLNKINSYKNPIINFNVIHPIKDEFIIEKLENLFGGRISWGELKDTDASEALLFDFKCYQISNVIFSLFEDNSKIYILFSKELKPPEILSL